MAYAILGTPKPAFFDSSGAPLASGTLTVQDPDDSSAKDTYPTAVDADADTNGVSTAYTLDSRGEIATQLWGRDGEDYKVILKDSAAATIYTIDEIRLPQPSRPQFLTADAVYTSTTTLTQISDLSNWLISPNTYVAIEGYLKVISSAISQDIKFALTNDQTFQESHWQYVNVNEDGTTTADSGITTTALTADIVNAKVHGITIKGFFLTHASEDTQVFFNAAQGTAGGTSTIEKGSWINLSVTN